MAKAIVLPPEVMERMKDEYLAGAIPTDLGPAYGVSHTWVRRKLRDMGVEMRPSHGGRQPLVLDEAEQVEIVEAYQASASFAYLERTYHHSRLILRQILIDHGVEIRGTGRIAGKDYLLDGRVRCTQCTIILEECLPEERAHEREGLCGECAGYVPERVAVM